MVTLESASLHDFQLTVESVEGSEPVTAVVTINVDWTGADDIRTETFHGRGDHSAHRTVDATVSGTITIDFKVLRSKREPSASRLVMPPDRRR